MNKQIVSEAVNAIQKSENKFKHVLDDTTAKKRLRDVTDAVKILDAALYELSTYGVNTVSLKKEYRHAFDAFLDLKDKIKHSRYDKFQSN